MNQVNKTMENTISGLAHIANNGSKEDVEKAIKIMEDGWMKINEVMSTAWFNKEISILWREYLKKKELKPKNA